MQSAAALGKAQRDRAGAEQETASTSNRSLSGCGLNRRSRSDGDFPAHQDQRVSLAELARHSSEDDCWMAIKGKVSASDA